MHYDLRLSIDLEKEVFSGDVAIRFNVTSENVTLIALNYFGIQLEDSGVIHLANESSSANLLQSVTPLSESEIVQFNIREFLVEGVEYVIRLNFTGEILNNLKGLYLSSYFTGEEKRCAIIIQFTHKSHMKLIVTPFQNHRNHLLCAQPGTPSLPLLR